MTTTPNDLIHSFQATDRFDGNYSGLTKREYFALCIYAGLMSSTFIHTEYVTVKDAVERADSLIEELNKIAEDITQPEEWIPVRGEKVPVNKLPLWAIHIIKDRATSDHVFLYVMENNISVRGVMVWEDTPEGVAVWEQVDNGNVRPLAKFHRVNPKTGRHIILSPIKFIRVIQNILLYGTV